MSRRTAADMSVNARPLARARACDRRRLYYKNDHPRRIDRYFDFFGTGRRSVPSNAAWALRSLA